MRVAFLPNHKTRDVNSYLDLLETALRKQGIDFESDGSDYLSWRRLLRSRDAVDVFHFHWIQYHYQRESGRASSVAAAKFAAKLVLARLLGYRIVWTLHNLFPHEQRHPWLDYIVRRVMAKLATGVITHCKEGQKQLSERFGRQHNVFVAPLGNYIGALPNSVTALTARRQLGIDQDRVVYLFFGVIRPYKALEQLLADFSALSLPGGELWIVGMPIDKVYAAQITAHACRMPNVRVVAEFVPDHEVQLYFRAADVVVAPYTQVLTSSSAIVALSYGRPVIAPAVGCLPEVVTKGCGLLYDPENSNGLRQALQQALLSDLQEMANNAHARARELNWANTARGTIQAYRA